MRTPTDCPTPMSQQESKTSRFSFFDKALSVMNRRLAEILGRPLPAEGEITRIDVVDGKTEDVQELVKNLRRDLFNLTKDRVEALKVLLPDTETTGISAMAGVKRHLQQEQRKRFSLLKDIDRLSRKLRGMSSVRPNSGLYALLQSAVTGKPSAEIVDYRFLSNHISLLEADADHIRKKLKWKEADLKTLQDDVCALKGRGDAAAAPPSSGLVIGFGANETDL
ncbi:hypothetical protein EGW08_000288 [Elysia chlorotica]|uniref:Uncharacterized protein n=1 Tax=Elysia chlorotica TaxID=188477 RepID=A0A3S1A221_ELYCH|nr:hypothetical protein EGW08_000288 [Elysia chlorotica]